MTTKMLWIIALAIIGIQICNGASKDVGSLVRNDEPLTTSNDGSEMKMCIGTKGRMSVPSNRDFHYKNLRDRYTNCTFVDGNLEITWLQNSSYDLSFLQDIREVSGYVLISHVDVNHVRLPRLKVIRGQNLFKLVVWNSEFGLFVSFSQMLTLELPALQDILNGSVGIYNNYNLCFIRTIEWDKIISGKDATSMYTYDFTSPERDCPSCHSSCEKGCWGEDAENCQQISKFNCSSQCSSGRCFGTESRDCCHEFCAGGCSGPTQRDCSSCKNVDDDGECKQVCPKGKFAFGFKCVQKCPNNLLSNDGMCVRACPPQKEAKNGECILCDGPCRKICLHDGIVHSGNIDKFDGCTIIEGSIEILDQTFVGFQQVYSNFSFGPRFMKIHPERLEVFSSVKEITGFLKIQGFDERFTNLSYFRNLEVIGGRQLLENLFSSLFIVKSLELSSLKSIVAGSIVIMENDLLCYADEIDWNTIKKSKDHEILVNANKNSTQCKIEDKVCSKECTSAGCWGAKNDQCLECRNFSYKKTCLLDCNSIDGIYEVSAKTCDDKPIKISESVSTSDSKKSFEPVYADEVSGSQCPASQYDQEGICFNCHGACKRCKGPRNIVSEDGCIDCDNSILMGTEEICIYPRSCPSGFYQDFLGPYDESNTRKSICRPCHPRCSTCTQFGFHESVCSKCKKYRQDGYCVNNCGQNYDADEKTKTCVPK